MNATTILNNLAAQGVEVQVHEDRLRCSPKSAVTPELLTLLQEHRGAILTALAGGDPAPEPPAQADEIPRRPPDRSGHVVELARHAGGWTWRIRRPDAADAALAAYQRSVRTRSLSFAEACRRELRQWPGATWLCSSPVI